MTTYVATFRGVRFLALSALALLVLVGALFFGAQSAAAQAGPGNFCVQDYRAGAVCTANDVVLANLSPDITQACTAVGDTAIVEFRATLEPNATTRYDIGIFISTDGAPALSGNACYHDFLKPATTPPVTGGVNLTGGAGPFRNEDADVCADMLQADGNIEYDLAPIAVLCVDNNNDGVVDPISTCTSWDNNSNTTCTDVSQAFPGTNSKCNCSDYTPNPPILIYRGYDFGDLPDTYGTLLASNGAQHAIQDTNNDGIPNVQGGVAAVWLGASVDFGPTGETDGQPSANADGDDLGAPLSDENGVAFPGPWYTNVPAGGMATVVVSASDAGACAGNRCYVGYWIDWDNNGTFNPAAYPGGEYYVAPVTVGTNNLTFPVPSTWTAPLSIRFRLYYEPTGVQGSYLPTGSSINGEVEDYKVNNIPQAVALASFAATCQAETPVITWETVSEIDTAGFNVWRSDTSAAPEIQLNASMIPAHPGSTQGYSYSWTDSTALVGQTYYYWLEDIDLNGATGLNGPIEAVCTGPTAVTVSDLEAKGSADSTTVWWAPLIALIIGIGLAVLLSRRVRAA